MKQSILTRIPDSLGKRYQGHDLRLADMNVIWSVGKTPLEALKALGRARRWGKLTHFNKMSDADDKDSEFTWGYRFRASGTGMKAAGIHVPGGVLVTWWK
jgi:hypothetical protein